MAGTVDNSAHGGMLPAALRAHPRLAGLDERTLVVAMASDLHQDGSYGQEWLLVTADRVLVLNGGVSEPLVDCALAELASVRAERLVGSGALIAVRGGQPLELLRFSHTRQRDFNRIAKYLADACAHARYQAGLTPRGDGSPPPLPHLVADTEETTRCPTCHLLLPAGTKVCPACVNKGQVLLRILGYMRPYWLKMAGVWVLLILSTLLSLVPPYLTRPLVDRVLVPTATEEIGTAAAPTNRSFRKDAVAGNAADGGRTPSMDRQGRLGMGSIDGRLHTLGWLVLGLLAAQIGALTVSIWRGRIMAGLGTQVAHDLRIEVFRHVQLHSLRFFDTRKTGDLMARISHDTESLESVLIDGVQFFVVNVLTLIGIGCVLLAMNWQLTLLTLLPVPIVLLASKALSRTLHRFFHTSWTRRGKLGAALNECLSGMRVVKAFARESQESDRFGLHSLGLRAATMRAEQAWSTYFPILSFLTGSGALIVWFVGGRQIIGGSALTLGTLMAFLAYLAMFFGPLQFLTRIVDWMARSLAAAQRVFELLDTQPDVPEAAEPVSMPRIEGRVSFRGITFGYEPYKPVLKNLTLDIEAGEMIGLVGHSGAGKSTTINLLCRFYDPDEGALLIDGVDARRIRQHDLRSQLGVVLQETFLFNGTIADNIAYGKPAASPEEIMAAAKAANAHDFIVGKPDGYDTMVGERGQQLSGGEKQRIAIARAILHSPRILILDEATASVDTDTEREIQEAIVRLTKGRTTIAIAHRLSTLRHAHRLAVLKNGEIIELGTHDELLAKDGEFHRLVAMQRDMASIVAIQG